MESTIAFFFNVHSFVTKSRDSNDASSWIGIFNGELILKK